MTSLKKTNIYDSNSLKIVLDDYTKGFMLEKGLTEDTIVSNFKIVIGGLGISLLTTTLVRSLFSLCNGLLCTFWESLYPG
jgi:hypothetical protein